MLHTQRSPTRRPAQLKTRCHSVAGLLWDTSNTPREST
jgi:hypothetical protein